MSTGHPFIRFLSVVLSAIYLATNSAFAHKPETSMWEERHRALQNSAPQLASLPLPSVIPAQAGIQSSNLFQKNVENLDSRLRTGTASTSRHDVYYGTGRGNDGLIPDLPLQFGSIR